MAPVECTSAGVCVCARQVLAGGRIHVENDDSLHMCNYKIKEATRSQTIRI